MPLSTASCANAMDGNTRMMPTTSHRLTTSETMVSSQVRLCARLRVVVASQAETDVGPAASQRDNDAADDKERSPDAPIRFLRSVVATKSRNHETTKRKSGPFRVSCFRGFVLSYFRVFVAKSRGRCLFPCGSNRLAHEKCRIRTGTRAILLHAAFVDFGGVEIAVAVDAHAVHAPHAAWMRASRAPGEPEVPVEV